MSSPQTIGTIIQVNNEVFYALSYTVYEREYGEIVFKFEGDNEAAFLRELKHRIELLEEKQ